MRLAATLSVVAALLLPDPASAKDSTLTPEELIARHLESVGPAEAREKLRARVLEGITSMKILIGGSASLQGRALFYSDPASRRVNLRFDNANYWGESLAFVGDKSEIGFVQTGRRSPLGGFLNTYDDPLREGILGGALSASWPLLDPSARKPKLKYEGLKKVEGRELHQLRYDPAKRRNDIRILLFFEPESFRHVRTTYSLTQPPPQAADITQSSRQQDTRYNLEETFEGFEALEGLTLPRQWVIRFSAQGETVRNSQWRFETVFERVRPGVATGDAPATQK